MRRPSVLFINRVYPPVRGATGRVLRDLATSFAREGWQVTVITTGPKAVKERDGGIRVIRVKGPERPRSVLVYLWLWMKMLVTALRHPPTHLLVTMSDPPLLILAGQMIKKFKKNRHIHWCHDLYPDVLPVLGFRLPRFMLNVFKRFTLSAMKQCDKLIVIGRCMAKNLTLDGIDPRHITVIPNWPDFELLASEVDVVNEIGEEMNGSGAVHGSYHDLLRENGWKPHDQQLKTGPKFRVLYAGNIGRAHPTEVILQAAEILNDPHPEIEFVFVGDGPRFDYIARERSKRRLDNIRLMPYQPSTRLRQTMESGDVHLISIKEEAAGLMVPSKLYSALAVKRPCVFIGPAQSEAAKVITDFKAGAVVHQDDPQALAERIVHLRQNGDDWFSAHSGAASARDVFVPADAIDAWINRAWGVVEPDMQDAIEEEQQKLAVGS